VEGSKNNRCHKPVVRWLAVGYGGQFQLSGRPTIQLPGFNLHRRQWSLLNRFRTCQGHCNGSGPLQCVPQEMGFDGRLLHLHEADEAAVNWLTTLWLLAYDNNNHHHHTITPWRQHTYQRGHYAADTFQEFSVSLPCPCGCPFRTRSRIHQSMETIQWESTYTQHRNTSLWHIWLYTWGSRGTMYSHFWSMPGIGVQNI